MEPMIFDALTWANAIQKVHPALTRRLVAKAREIASKLPEQPQLMDIKAVHEDLVGLRSIIRNAAQMTSDWDTWRYRCSNLELALWALGVDHYLATHGRPG